MTNFIFLISKYFDMIAFLLSFEIICSVIITVLIFQVSILFLFQYKRSHEVLMLLLMICFFAFTGSSMFYFARIFITPENVFYRIEVVLRFAAFTTFVYMFERQVKQRKFIYLTILCGLCILLLLVLPYNIAYNFGFTIYGAAIVVLLFFIRTFRLTEGKIHKKIRSSILGSLILGIGIGASADLMVATIGDFLIPVGLVIQVVGMIIIGLSFYIIHSADEFTWYKNTKSLYLIFNSVCLFAHSFEKNERIKEADLYGSGLASVLIVAQSILQSDEPPKHIEFQNTNFVVKKSTEKYGGDHLIAILIVKKNLIILNEKLDNFISKFESRFKDLLDKWDGNTAPFSEGSIDLIKIFQVKEDQKI